MAKRKHDPIPTLRIKKGDSLQTIYAKAKKAFTAADLQKYTEIEEGIPAEEVLAELQAIQREATRKRTRRKAPPSLRKVRPGRRSKVVRESGMIAGNVAHTSATGRDNVAKRKNNKRRSKEEEELYAKMRRKFTAADLQKYTVIEKGIPFDKVLAKMERIVREESRKRK
jgi:hypothetical protein